MHISTQFEIINVDVESTIYQYVRSNLNQVILKNCGTSKPSHNQDVVEEYLFEGLTPGGSPCRRFGGATGTSTKRRECLLRRHVPRSLGHIESIALILAVVLVVQRPGWFLVLLHPLLIGHVLDVLLLHDSEMVNTVLDIVIIARDNNQAGIYITLSRKTNVHFKVIHDLSDASSTLTNDHGMYSWVNADLLVDHTLKLSNDLQDGIASFIGLLLVPGDGDDALLLGLLPW